MLQLECVDLLHVLLHQPPPRLHLLPLAVGDLKQVKVNSSASVGFVTDLLLQQGAVVEGGAFPQRLDRGGAGGGGVAEGGRGLGEEGGLAAQAAALLRLLGLDWLLLLGNIQLNNRQQIIEVSSHGVGRQTEWLKL